MHVVEVVRQAGVQQIVGVVGHVRKPRDADLGENDGEEHYPHEDKHGLSGAAHASRPYRILIHRSVKAHLRLRLLGRLPLSSSTAV